MTIRQTIGTAVPASGRIAWIDYVKGIAISLVVFGHCMRGLASAGIIPQNGEFAVVDYLIYTFHVPLFFFLSGVFGAQVLPFLDRRFWFGRLRSILWPYLVWMTIELTILSLFAGSTNMGGIEVGPATYLYAPISPFWFLYALAFCALFVHAVLRVGPLALGLSVPIFVAGQFAPEGIVPLTTWGVLYFSLGAACSGIVRSPRFDRIIVALPTLIFSAVAWSAIGLAFRAAGLSSQIAVPAAMLGGVAAICCARRLQGGFQNAPGFAWLGYLGQISLTILVVHVLGTAGTRIILSAVGVQNPVVHLVLGTAVGLAGPVLVQMTCMRLRLTGLLGLPRVSRDAGLSRRVEGPNVTAA